MSHNRIRTACTVFRPKGRPTSSSRLAKVTCQVYFPSPARSTLSAAIRPEDTHRSSSLRKIHAAVDIEYVAGDIAGFVARQEHDGGGDIAAAAHAPQGNAHF